jgi:hypothetical protein
MPGRLVALTAAAWCALQVVTGGAAQAHDRRPGVLSIAEVDAGLYRLQLVPPVDSRGDDTEVTVQLPAGCARRGDRVQCDGGLVGIVAVRGMRGPSMRTVVQLTRRDGSRADWIVSADAPAIQIDAAAPPTWLAWIRIGIDHILGGLDHLGFVLGLLLVLGLGVRPVLDRRLLVTISAFTVAHSLTLALAASGVVHPAIAATEACIAASVLLVAREATHDRPTLIRRWPWLAAGIFGLIHGFGFAGALADLGLATDALAGPLLWFNLGVEIGQLMVVGLVVLAAWLIGNLGGQRASAGRRLHRTCCYLLGGVAAWWLVERALVVAAG